MRLKSAAVNVAHHPDTENTPFIEEVLRFFLAPGTMKSKVGGSLSAQKSKHSIKINAHMGWIP